MSSRSSSSSAERHRRPGHRHHHCHHCRHHHDLSRSSSDEWGPPAAISCAPPLHRRLESNIQRDKYVKFDHLRHPSHSGACIQSDPTLHWDELKEDVYVWCFTRHVIPHRPIPTAAPLLGSPFVTGLTSTAASAHRLPHPPPQSLGLPPRPLAERSAASTTMADATGATNALTPTCAGPRAAMVPTRTGAVPSGQPELTRAHTPLRHSRFKRELAHHPDRAWVSKLLHSIKYGVDIGYMGPRQPMDAPNLPSAHTHPQVITAQLSKEVDSGRIRGPFAQRPFPALRCSSLGVVRATGGG